MMDSFIDILYRITVFEWLLLSLLSTDIWVQYLRLKEQKNQRRVLSLISEEVSANQDLLVRVASIVSKPNNNNNKVKK